MIAWLWPLLGDRFFSRIEDWGCRVSWYRAVCVLGTATLVIVLRLTVFPFIGPPVPQTMDEFSYLLAADTFAHGRLANPPHPMWVFLETFHVNQFPTYGSKFPPGQGAVLALGQLLGHPWIGVLLSVACMCAAITWMLQAWVPARWALLGGILAVLQFGAINYWMESYWGGAIAGIGGALVMGALLRILHWQRPKDAILLGVGISILANSRPYEGLIYCFPVVAALAWCLFRRRDPGPRVILFRVAGPLAAVVVLTGAFIAFYNWRVTGDYLQLPYRLYDQTYQTTPSFQWQKLGPPPHYSNLQFEAFYSATREGWLKDQFTWTWKGVKHVFLEKLVKLQRFYAPPELGIPLMVALLGMTKNRKVGFCLLVSAFFFAGLLCVMWFFPHYAAPFTATVYVLIVFGFRYLRLWNVRGRPVGLGLSRALVLFHLVLFLAQVAAATLTHTVHRDSGWAQARAQMGAKLESMPGQHLVLVRYSPAHDPNRELVYNRADIDRAKVVWAREIPGRDMTPLLRYFRVRNLWLVEADASPTPELSRYDVAMPLPGLSQPSETPTPADRKSSTILNINHEH